MARASAVIAALWRHMATWNCVDIGSGDDLLPDGTKPLPEQMFTYEYWGAVTLTSGKFHKRCHTDQLLKLN